MTAEIVCECGNGCEMPHKHRDIASVSALPLDVDAIMAEIDRRIVAENRLPAAGWRVLAITRDVLSGLSESGSPPTDAEHAEGWPHSCPTCKRAFGSAPTPPGEER